MMTAFSEGLALADKAGLSQQTLLEVLASTYPLSYCNACNIVDFDHIYRTQKSYN